MFERIADRHQLINVPNRPIKIELDEHQKNVHDEQSRNKIKYTIDNDDDDDDDGFISFKHNRIQIATNKSTS